ncbi:MAG: TIGR01244 family sulfur transferase [Hyphomicrobiales bacterium]
MMMDIRKVTESFAVSPQIRPEDVQTLADEGYKTIICNRPDDEEFGQPLFEAIAAKATELGLEFHHLPITSGMFGPQHVTQMAELVENGSGKVIAYCRSGTRSIMLWAFQEVTKRPRDEVLALAEAAGYDLSQQL